MIVRLRQTGLLILLSYFLTSTPVSALTDGNTQDKLIIFSATDTEAIQPVIAAFRQRMPHITVDYQEYQTSELYHSLQHLTSEQMPDLVISSAMDLQIKLVNDGYAQAFTDPVTQALPQWANWRNEAFGFTFEPVVIAYNKAAFTGLIPPETHEELALSLRNHTQFYTNRVDSYDIRLSGVGYLFASQDEINSSISSRLKENLGRVVTHLHCCTSQIIENLSNGQSVLGYNLLGSYVMKHAETDPNIGVIFPQDYTLVMSRVAFITKQAPNPTNAKAFLRFLLSIEGQQIIADDSGLIALHPQAQGPFTSGKLTQDYPLRFKPIPLGPALMVYLDQLKQRRFINEWSNTMLYDAVIP